MSLPQWGGRLAFFWSWWFLPLVAEPGLQVPSPKSSKLFSKLPLAPGLLLLQERLQSLSSVSFVWSQRGLVWTQLIHHPRQTGITITWYFILNVFPNTWIGMFRNRRCREASRFGHSAPKPRGGGICLRKYFQVVFSSLETWAMEAAETEGVFQHHQGQTGPKLSKSRPVHFFASTKLLLRK